MVLNIPNNFHWWQKHNINDHQPIYLLIVCTSEILIQNLYITTVLKRMHIVQQYLHNSIQTQMPSNTTLLQNERRVKTTKPGLKNNDHLGTRRYLEGWEECMFLTAHSQDSKVTHKMFGVKKQVEGWLPLVFPGQRLSSKPHPVYLLLAHHLFCKAKPQSQCECFGMLKEPSAFFPV